MIKNDFWIFSQSIKKGGMIEPFVSPAVREGVISYGLSSFGYDMRIADEYKIFTPNPYNTVVDPKAIDTRAFQDFKGDVCYIPPNSYALGRSVEYFRIPENVFCIVLGKSTLARAGIIVNVTPGEPGWEGYWTIEISNATPLPAKIYSNEGIAQVLFFEGERPVINYSDKQGKYMYQQGIVLPIVEERKP